MAELKAVKRMVRTRLILLFAAFASGAILLVLMTAALSDERIPSQDQEVLDWVRDIDLPGLESASSVLSVITGSWGAVVGGVAVVGALLISGRSRAAGRLAIVLALAGIATVLADVTLGKIVAHTRPSGFEDGKSFPSGHVLGVTIVVGALAYFVARSGAPRAGRFMLLAALLLLGIAVGFSRLFENEHWPSDVAAGYLAGGLWLFLLIPLLQWEERVMVRRAASPPD